MNNYTIYKPNEKQVISNYFYLLDNKINGLVQYKDFYNPDYIILNQQLVAGDQLFYTDGELIDIGILEQVTIDETTTTYIHAYKLRPHQGLLNIYGTNTYIKYSADDVNPQKIDQGFVIISNAMVELSAPPSNEQLLSESYPLADAQQFLLESSSIAEDYDPAILLKDPNNYLIHSLGSSGTYYIPQGWSPSSTWTYTPNATDLYGSSIYFTAAPTQTRWFHKDNITYNSNHYFLYNAALTEQILQLNSIESYSIISTQDSIWGVQYILGDEILTDGVGDNFEEIICEEKVATYTQLSEDKQMCNYYSIQTDIPNNLYNVYINYY